jgi:hypothetical protein
MRWVPSFAPFPGLWNRMGNGTSRAVGGVPRLLGKPWPTTVGLMPRERGSAARDPSGRDGDAQLPGRSIYYLESGGTVPAPEFLDASPGAIDAQFTAVLDAVVAASSPRFSMDGSS